MQAGKLANIEKELLICPNGFQSKTYFNSSSSRSGGYGIAIKLQVNVIDSLMMMKTEFHYLMKWYEIVF